MTCFYNTTGNQTYTDLAWIGYDFIERKMGNRDNKTDPESSKTSNSRART